jgi:coproporphyrinogen III oxidase
VSTRVPRERISAWITGLHNRITDFFQHHEGEIRFREDPWLREGGGGGVCRVLEGRIFEKVGVNRAAVEGRLPAATAARLGWQGADRKADLGFFATGVSVVAHPASPMVPIVHQNVRYVEILDPADGTLLDAWFGGGIDLTPTYPHPEDAVLFHRVLRAMCRRHHPPFYRRFKETCDAYFVNGHRDDEMRGVGGLFFDNLRAGDGNPLDGEQLFAFVRDAGAVMLDAYGPILSRRKAMDFGERERRFQLYRRGRYAEFNLLHDRGTKFGLETCARTESVLMSLPPLARWDYGLAFEAGSFEDRLLRMLTPLDWAEGLEAVSAALDDGDVAGPSAEPAAGDVRPLRPA